MLVRRVEVARLVVLVLFVGARFIAPLLPFDASAGVDVSLTLPVAAMTSAGGSDEAVSALSEDEVGTGMSVRPSAGDSDAA